MPGEVERFLRIQVPRGRDSSAASIGKSWHTLANADKVSVLEQLTLMAPNETTGVEEKRFIFHIRFVDGVRRGARITYLGNHFTVLAVSDSKRLVGLELSCVPEVETPTL
jgi:hypothetical protein